jgi:hypothetical protein
MAIVSPSFATDTRTLGSLVNAGQTVNFDISDAKLKTMLGVKVIGGATCQFRAASFLWEYNGQFTSYQGGGLTTLNPANYQTIHAWEVRIFGVPARDIPWRRI